MLKESKFTEIDEEFICENCGKKVPKLGYSCRNHCPYCLHSKHVDKNPGDRAEECHGDLEPVSLEINGKKGYVIVFKCKKCGAIRKNKAAKDDNIQTVTTIYNSKTTSIESTDFVFTNVFRIDIIDESIDDINNIVSVVKSGNRFEGKEFTNGNLNREV